MGGPSHLETWRRVATARGLNSHMDTDVAVEAPAWGQRRGAERGSSNVAFQATGMFVTSFFSFLQLCGTGMLDLETPIHHQYQQRIAPVCSTDRLSKKQRDRLHFSTSSLGEHQQCERDARLRGCLWAHHYFTMKVRPCSRGRQCAMQLFMQHSMTMGTFAFLRVDFMQRGPSRWPRPLCHFLYSRQLIANVHPKFFKMMIP